MSRLANRDTRARARTSTQDQVGAGYRGRGGAKRMFGMLEMRRMDGAGPMGAAQATEWH